MPGKKRSSTGLPKAADGRGKKPSANKNVPSQGTSKDMRVKGRGAKPGPKQGSKNKKQS